MYLANEAIVFVKSIIFGMGIGLILDFFRIIRKTIKHNDILVILQDCLFSILTFAYILILLYYINQGEIRFYILLGILLSNVIYFLKISKYIIKVSGYILNVFKVPFVKFSKKNKEFEKNT